MANRLGLSSRRITNPAERGDSRKRIMIALYLIWASSKYNPYQNGSFNLTNFNRFKYNKKQGSNPNDGNVLVEIISLENDLLDYSACPISLDYQSSKIAGIYFDDFSFYSNRGFPGGNDFNNFTYDLRLYNNAGSVKSLGNLEQNNSDLPDYWVLVVDENYRDSGDYGLVGTYHLYQPVSLIDSNLDAIMKIPVIGGNDTVQVGNHPEKINSLIPIFFLAYIDEEGDESDFFTSVGYAVDIASIFAGGYGALTKLKYLRSLSGFTDSIIAGSEFGTDVIVSLYVSLTAEAINLTSGTLSFLIKLTGDLYANESWFKTLKNTLIWIEIFSACGSVLSERMLRISTKGLVDDFNANNTWPNEFIDDERGLDAANTLTQISGAILDISSKLFIKYKSSSVKMFDELLSKQPSDFKPLFVQHTPEKVDEILQFAFNNKIGRNEVSEMLFISCKKTKLIETSQLFLQVKYYTFVTKVKGYPAGFLSLSKFEDFSTDVKNYWQDVFLYYDSNVNTSLSSLKYEFKIQGSASRKRIPSDPLPDNVDESDFIGLDAPADIEYAVLMDTENFKLFLDELKKVSEETLEAGSIGRQKFDNAINNARISGNLPYKPLLKLRANGKNVVKEMRKKAFLNMTGFAEAENINFAFIQKGSKLDLGPYIDFIQ